MLQYYEQRAPQYDEAYIHGTGTTSIAQPDVFVREARTLADIVGRTASGRLLDLACGTAYWFPHYARRCPSVTMFDQSASMLAQARRRVEAFDGAPPCVFVQGDVLEHQFEPGSHDCALIGFVLSHLTPAQEDEVFRVIRRVLGTSGSFLILDSAWTPMRARYNSKVERQPRALNDGSRFEIYKRYIDQEDIERWRTEHSADVQVEYFGDALCAVSGRFRG
jgi:demethylmenaquinone methyltransferase/2-methoxy-6-polyprenyl-1,4-benzoquinol methylase